MRADEAEVDFRDFCAEELDSTSLQRSHRHHLPLHAPSLPSGAVVDRAHRGKNITVDHRAGQHAGRCCKNTSTCTGHGAELHETDIRRRIISFHGVLLATCVALMWATEVTMCEHYTPRSRGRGSRTTIPLEFISYRSQSVCQAHQRIGKS